MSVVAVSLSESKSAFQDYFELFGLQKHFQIDLSALEKAYLLIQQEVHPDKHATAGDSQKRASLQMATYANSAYQTLRNPVKRGLYLCELAGLDPKLETNTAMPVAFLMQQMEWREALDEIRQDINAIEKLLVEVTRCKQSYLLEIQHLFDDLGDAQGALDKLRASLFMERFQDELDNAMADLL